MTHTPAREGLPELPDSFGARQTILQMQIGASAPTKSISDSIARLEQIAEDHGNACYDAGYRAALAAIAGREAQGHASQPTPGGGEVFYRCEDCGTGEVELTRTCHNSSCGHYAQEASVYKGWDAALPHPQPESGFVHGHRTMDDFPATPPPPSDAAQGVQAVRVDEARYQMARRVLTLEAVTPLMRDHFRFGDYAYMKKIDAALDDAIRAAHKGEGNGR